MENPFPVLCQQIRHLRNTKWIHKVLVVMETLVTKEAPLSASVADYRIICRVCQKQFAEYTCPRCNSRYCSLQCYKGHSLRCTESFMRENVMEEMGQVQLDDEMKRKMLDILKRFHSEEEMDYEEEEDDSGLSEQTVEKFLSGENFDLHDLNPQELKRFQRAVATGELSKLIEPWVPWWLKLSSRTISLSKDGTPLIKPVDDSSAKVTAEDISEFEGNDSAIPAGPESPLPLLSKLCRAEPSPLLPVHLVDILYSYCFTLRLYNGDWHCDPSGAALVVLHISSVLGEGCRPETVAEALGHCMEASCSPIYRSAGGFQLGLGLLDDVIRLLSLGNNALICLLCDLRRLMVTGEKMLKEEKSRKTRRDENRNKLKRAERKLHFLMCWVHEQLLEVFSCTGDLVQMEKATLASTDRNPKHGKTEKRRVPQGEVLVEEVR